MITIPIIAIHGLNGHAFNTWASGEVMWLRDFLPGHFPQARIMTYGYDSNVRHSNGVSGISDFAKKLLTLLVDHWRGKEEKERPIIFICHSLGGIVVKAALNMAREEERTHIINRVSNISSNTSRRECNRGL
ncbi:hypothetical protein BD779DRAFT_281145 [Infundibulicybe gibba]|nr:hypothetical protein BD779DRAFT_281145 [Infundibulicybe gibba]